MKEGRKGGRREGREGGTKEGGKDRTLQDMAVEFSRQTVAARRAITALNRVPRLEFFTKICHLWILFTSWERCTCLPIRPLIFSPSTVGEHDTRILATNFTLEFSLFTATNFIWLFLWLGKYHLSLPSAARSSSGLFPSSYFFHNSSFSPCLPHAHPISTTLIWWLDNDCQSLSPNCDIFSSLLMLTGRS